MAFSLFVWVSIGAAEQGFPLMAVIVAVILGGAVVAFSPWAAPPLDLKAVEEAANGATIAVLLFRFVICAGATAAALWGLIAGEFPVTYVRQ